MTTIHIIRHGEAENPNKILYGRLPNFHLSPTGKIQAQNTAKYLANQTITQIYTSPLSRAQETAKIINQPHQLKINSLPQLIESSNKFQGKKINSIKDLIKYPSHWKYLYNPFKPSWGEPYTQIAFRMLQSLLYVKAQTTQGNSICISHQLPIEILRRFITQKSLWHHPRNRICDLASVTSITFSSSEPLASIKKVEYWNPNQPKPKIIWEIENK